MLCGCLTVEKTVYKFDFAAGVYEIDYHDIRSQLDGGKDVSDRDWVSLKEELAKTDNFGPGVTVKSKKLFQDGDMLSGKAVYQVECVSCYETKAKLMQYLFSEGVWAIRDNELTLTFSADEMTEANGKSSETDMHDIYSWPLDVEKIEFIVYDDFAESESLLDKYLQEQEAGTLP
jgi:hypothetical protein